MRKYPRGAVALGLALGLSACLDLDVVNENQPDNERALTEPADVESVIQSSWRIWYNVLHGLADVAIPFPLIADEQTNTSVQRAVQWSQEPRLAFRNDQLAEQIWVPRRGYDGFSECVANTNDGLRRIKDGLRVRTLNPGADSVTDNTDRAYVFAKIWQGVCAGYLALQLDRFAMATEDSILPAGWGELVAWERANLKPYRDGMEVAIRSLEQAIAHIEESPVFSTPDTWVPGNGYTSDQWKQFAHTMIARLLVYEARTPEERAAVDWQKVLFHTERGLTFDWGPVLQSGIITDPSYLARLTTTASNQMRADPHLVGPADQSGNYQAWLAKPVDQRTAFTITTPDRRVTGNTPTSSGAYFRYNSSLSVFSPDRGTYNQSYYQWYRRSNYGGFISTTGFFSLASVDENRLLRAEAFLRTGDLQQAATLINVTRTRGLKLGSSTVASNLPPVTPAGAPLVNGACVPRTRDGNCGDLMDALVYERTIELTGQNPQRMWHDMRGFGRLQPGTWLHLPIPARYLVQMGVPAYTFGGVGGEGAAR
jgi:hypothetical protein